MTTLEEIATRRALAVPRQIPAIWQCNSMTELIPRATRYDLQLKVRYRSSSAAQWRQGTTSNISRSGVLFSVDNEDGCLALGSMLELLLTLGIEGGPAKVQVLCRGPVVRQAPRGDSATELAIRIVRYQMGASETVGKA